MDSKSCLAEAFQNPENFKTENDTPALDAEQYKKGLETGQNAQHISIAVNGVWGAKMNDGGHVASYERIGYHASTAALLRGFLASGVKIKVHRYQDGKFRETELNGQPV